MKLLSPYIAILVILLLSACSSCKRKEEKTNMPVQEEIRKHFNFQVGTYWVYQDSVSGNVDSFVVESNTPGYGVEIFNSNATQDLINIIIRQYRNNVLPPESFVFGCSIRDNYFLIASSFEPSGSYSVAYGPLFVYPFGVGALPVIGGVDRDGDGAIINVHSSFSVNNIAYNNVAEVSNHFESTTSNKAHDDYFFICPDVGIVKMKITRANGLHRVWKLLRKN